MNLKPGDIIKPARKTPVTEEVIWCDGVRVTTKYEYKDTVEYYTRDMADIERYWELAEEN